MQPILLDGHTLTLADLHAVVSGRLVAITPAAMARMTASRACIEGIIAEGRVVYGVNTGFGKLANIHIPDSELDQLQLNLVLSHACGVGDPIPAPIVRAMAVWAYRRLASPEAVAAARNLHYPGELDPDVRKEWDTGTTS